MNGQIILTRGGVMSYYEFTWPMNDRLTDEAWQQMLASGSEPSLPTWTESFVIDASSAMFVLMALPLVKFEK